MKSLSEIETTSKRASRALGYSWGISEEVGKSVRLLEMFNFEGIKNLKEYLNEKKEKKFENLNLINQNNECSGFSYCPIILGVSFLDQIEKIEKIKTINFSKIAYPLLFLPFLSRAQRLLVKKFFLSLKKMNFY